MGQRKIHQPSNVKHKTAARVPVDPAKLTHHRKGSYSKVRTTPRPESVYQQAEGEVPKALLPWRRRPSVLRGTYNRTRSSRKMDIDADEYAEAVSSKPVAAPSSSDYNYDYDYDSKAASKLPTPAKAKPASEKSVKQQSPKHHEEEDYENDYYGTSEAIKQLDSLLDDEAHAPTPSSAEDRSLMSKKSKQGSKYSVPEPSPFLNVYKASSAAGHLASKGNMPVSSFESFKVSMFLVNFALFMLLNMHSRRISGLALCAIPYCIT
jgi:hypothetical protein